MRSVTIDQFSSQVSLHQFLRNEFPKGYVEKVFRKNGVRVNGLRGKRDTILHVGDVLTFYVPFEQHTVKTFHFDPSCILFENDDFVVISKPVDWAVHEGKEISFHQSIIGQLITYYKEKNIIPSLVHRLDKDTSGCLLVIKKKELVPVFEDLFEKNKIEKEYIALVKGKFTHTIGKITTPLPGRNKVPVSAYTTYHVKKYFPLSNVSIVHVHIKTGRMHQIRLHFASIKHPVVMDDEHGDFSFNKKFRKTYKLKRQFLHARLLSFHYKEKLYSFSAPLPDDLATTLKNLM